MIHLEESAMHEQTSRIRHIIDASGTIREQPTGDRPRARSTVSAIMTAAPYCVRDDVAIDEVTSLLLARGFSAVPVVDAEGRALGIVSKTDLLQHAHAGGRRDAPVREVMMAMVFAVEPTSPIGDAAALMAGEGVHRVPVVDGRGAVVGILSTIDIVRWFGQLAGYRL
jgi:CBS domain-containing protein